MAKSCNGKAFVRIAILLSFILLVSGIIFEMPQSFAHFDHRPHYNGREDWVGPIAIFQALDPDYAMPGEPTSIKFSIQDQDGNDLYNIATMVEIYDAITGERVYAIPWTEREIGDFATFYTFPKAGNYHIVVSVENGQVNVNRIDPERSMLSSTAGCNCYRSVFTVNISGGFGDIWNVTTYFAMLMPVAILGAILATSYRNRRRRGIVTKQELFKYLVMLAAIAGGVVHLAVYADHALLRLEYSIFLLSAAVGQVIYGLLYTIITLTDNTSSRSDIVSLRVYYRKSLIVNLIGLIGTCVLLGLYAYAVIFPPPLSRTDMPEDLDFAGILAKSLEVFLVGGVLYMMKWEKQKMQRQIAEIG